MPIFIDRHVDAIRELIGREEYPAPKVHLNPEVKDFYQFTTADLLVEDYQAGPQIKNIPIRCIGKTGGRTT